MRLPQTFRKSNAFTLIEVILAVAISTGLLLVALHFYHQTTNLRDQVLKETENISTCRLLMEKLSMELRSSQANDWYGFTGASNSIQFVTCGFPEEIEATNRQSFTGARLLLVNYSLASSEDGTNVMVSGLMRDEQLLSRTGSITLVSSATNAPVGVLSFNGDDLFNEFMATTSTNEVEVFAENVQRLQFRYWSGTKWLESWDELFPPRAVEIQISTAPFTGLEGEGEDGADLFRRIVYIPAGKLPLDDFEFDMFEMSSGQNSNAFAQE